MLTTQTIQAQDWADYAEGHSRHQWAAITKTAEPHFPKSARGYQCRMMVSGVSFPEMVSTTRLDLAVRFAQEALGRDEVRGIRYPLESRSDLGFRDRD